MGGLSEIFKTAVITSCAGGALTIVLAALRPITSRIFGHAWQYYIYLAALAVMLVPVSFGSPYSPYPEPIEATGQTQPDVINAPDADITAASVPEQNAVTVAEHAPRSYAPTIFSALKYIWLAGAVLFLLGAAVSYVRFIRLLNKNSRIAECELFNKVKLQMGIKRKIILKYSAVTDAPLMVGIIRPTLVLSERDMGERELRCVLLHELTHYKRQDLLYKLLALIVNAAHWFNPIAYLLVRLINEDCEISCDVSVTRRMSGTEKMDYMRTIVNLMQDKGERNYV